MTFHRVTRQREGVAVTETARGYDVRLNHTTFDAYARKFRQSEYTHFGEYMLYGVLMKGITEEPKVA